MDTIVQYEQMPGLGTMDTSPNSLSDDIVANFLANGSQDTLQPYMMNQSKHEIPGSSVIQPLHMPAVPGLSMSTFLDTPMDAVDARTEPPLLSSAGYVPVDPFSVLQPTDNVDLNHDPAISSQDPTSSMLSTSSTFGGAPLEFDSGSVFSGRNRRSSSLSPQSLTSNFASLSPPQQQTTPTLDYSSAASNSSADDDLQTPPRGVIGQMLKEYVVFVSCSNC